MNELKTEDILEKLSSPNETWYNVKYEDLIEATGCEVIDSLYMGSYQGDLLMIVSKNYRFGVLSTGYGSCAGCDALQACRDPNEYVNLAKSLYDNIVWKEPDEIIDYLENKDWESEYYGKQEGLPEFISKIKEQIIIRYLARI